MIEHIGGAWPARLVGQRLELSAAVLVTRGEGALLEILLVRRSPELATFPGAWALPGGVLDPTDGDPAAGETSFLACAARELFEETGILLPALEDAATKHGVVGAERERLRHALLSRTDGRAARAEWSTLVRDANDPYAALRPFSWATTPAFAARRYRTLYVHAHDVTRAEPTIVHGELVECAFVKPAEAWRAWHAGEMRVVPPLVFLLDRLTRPGATLERALTEAGDRGRAVDGGALHVVAPGPGVLVAPLLTPTIPPATTTNCYIVGRERAYVVDPGTWDEAEREKLFGFLDVARGFDLDLAGVVVTHHHKDHVGSVAATAERYRLPVFAHPLTLRRLPVRPADPRPLEDGDRLPLGDPDDRVPWTLTAYHTPGHDAGHLVFVESRRRAVIAGDLVSTLSTIVIDPPEGHMATYLASLQRVRDLDVGVLLPAHGAAAPDGAAVLGRYLEHRAARERKLLAALARDEGALAESLVARVYDDVDRSMHAVAARSLCAGLEKLAEEGRARVGADGRWYAAP